MTTIEWTRGDDGTDGKVYEWPEDLRVRQWPEVSR